MGVFYRHFGAFIEFRVGPKTASNPSGLKVRVMKVKTVRGEYAGSAEQIKLAGGSNNDHKDEYDPFETAKREYEEETKRVPKPNIPKRFVHPYTQKADNPQFYYLGFEDEFTGEARDYVDQDGDDDLYPPYWLEVEQSGVIFKTHQKAVDAAVRYYIQNYETPPYDQRRVLVG